MTAARSQLALSSARSIDWSQWIDLAEAAPKLGLSDRQLRRRCEQLAEQGLAMQHRGPAAGGSTSGGGGKPRWWIARRYDPRLAPGVVGQKFAEPDMTGVPLPKQDEARQRLACVMALRRLRQSASGDMGAQMPGLIDQLKRDFPKLRISQSSLYRWDRDYQTPSDLPKLVDSRGGGEQSADPRCWDYFRDHFLHYNAPKKSESWRKTKLWARGEGLTWCALRTCLAQIDERIPPEVQRYYREREKWQMLDAPKLDQDTERFAAGRCWVGDHTQADCFVREGERVFRPWITAWQDWRTRKIVGFVVNVKPNADTILAAFRAGMMDADNMGGPEHVDVDNGRDYKGWMWDGRTKMERRRVLNSDYIPEPTFRGIFGQLNIEPHFSIAFNPNGKARMERWFGVLHDQHDRSFATYCGKDPTSRPYGLNDRKQQLTKIPTIAEYRDKLAGFVAAWNRNPDHQIPDLVEDGVRLSPAQAMATWCRTRRAFGEHVLDLCLMHWERPVSMTQRGVSLQIYGVRLRYGQHDAVLMPYKGTKRKLICAFDPNDLRSVHVYDAKTMELLTIAAENLLGGQEGPVGRRVIEEFARRSKAHRELLKSQRGKTTIDYLPAVQQMHQAGDLPEVAPPMDEGVKPVRTSFDGQSKAVQRAQLRQAAGGETVDARGKSAPDADASDQPADELADLVSGAIGRIGPADNEMDDLLAGISLDDLALNQTDDQAHSLDDLDFGAATVAEPLDDDTDVDDLLDGPLPDSRTDDGGGHLLDELR